MILLAVLLVALVVVAAFGHIIHSLLVEQRRLVAIITAPSPHAAHAAALDRPKPADGDPAPYQRLIGT